MASTQQKDAARDLIWKFGKKTTPGVFSQFSRKTVTNDLAARVDVPSRINQKGAGVCSVAAVMFSLADDSPEAYARFVTDLYDVGRATIGTLKIAPSADLKKYALPAGSSMSPADWIPLASIRDSQNWIYDFDSYKDEDGASTNGDVEDWFEAFGYTKVEKDVSWVGSTMDETNLRKASDRARAGYKVVLAINASILDSDSKKDGGDLNHHVVLMAPIIFGKGTIRIKLYTWGEEMSLPQKGDLKLSRFLKHYFGFIAGKF